MNEGQTHWEGCEESHHDCALVKLRAAQERIAQLTAEVALHVDAAIAQTEKAGELQARVRELEPDAERYRWVLEEMDNRKWGHLPFVSPTHDYDEIARAADITAAIDKARKEPT